MSAPLDSSAPDSQATNTHAGQGDALPSAKDGDATVAPPSPLRSVFRNTLPCSFGEYELVEQIGSGGMGVVYKARQRVGDGERFVALKVIQSGRLVSPQAIERFLQEAR